MCTHRARSLSYDTNFWSLYTLNFSRDTYTHWIGSKIYGKSFSSSKNVQFVEDNCSIMYLLKIIRCFQWILNFKHFSATHSKLTIWIRKSTLFCLQYIWRQAQAYCEGFRLFIMIYLTSPLFPSSYFPPLSNYIYFCSANFRNNIHLLHVRLIIYLMGMSRISKAR